MKPPVFKNPEQLFKEAIDAAVGPLKQKLADAIVEDERLYAAVEEVTPDRVKADADALFTRACNRDSAAVGEIEAVGGLELWKLRRGGLYPVRESYRKASAMGQVELLEELSARLIEKLAAANEVIRAQWDALLEFHGEQPSLSIWDARTRNLCNALRHMPEAARVGTGIGYLITAAGLRDHVMSNAVN
jgi:hypothetical protein